MNEEIIKEIWQAMDSFLTEAKDQYGNERNLERLNQDRHLFMEKMEKALTEARVEERSKIILELRENWNYELDFAKENLEKLIHYINKISL